MRETKHQISRNRGHKRALVTYAHNARERIINNTANCNCELFYINWLLANNKINRVEWSYLKQRIINAESDRLYLEYNHYIIGGSHESLEK